LMRQRAIDRLAGDVLSLASVGGCVEKGSIASRRSFADAQDDGMDPRPLIYGLAMGQE
jgi:hypothetical protein